MPKLSVIVPVYNVEQYIKKCLESLINQTCSDMEILVVNDGSPDNSQKIIDEYHEKYPNLIVPLLKENGGLGDARNYGIEHAKGDYLAFVDSDDYLDSDFFERLIETLETNQSDIAICDIKYIWEDASREPFVVEGLNPNGKSTISQAMLGHLSVCNKVFKRHLFNDVRFPKGMWHEDIPVTLRLLPQAKVSYLSDVYYHYIQREQSIMSTKTDKRMYHIFEIMEDVYQFYLKNDLLADYYDELEYLFIEHLRLYGPNRFLGSKDYKSLEKAANRLLKDKFPKWKKNVFYKALSVKQKVRILLYNKYMQRCLKILLFRK